MPRPPRRTVRLRVAQGEARFAEPWVSCEINLTPLCRGLRAATAERLEKMHLFFSLRPSVSARVLPRVPRASDRTLHPTNAKIGPSRGPGLQSLDSLHPGLSSCRAYGTRVHRIATTEDTEDTRGQGTGYRGQGIGANLGLSREREAWHSRSPCRGPHKADFALWGG